MTVTHDRETHATPWRTLHHQSDTNNDTGWHRHSIRAMLYDDRLGWLLVEMYASIRSSHTPGRSFMHTTLTTLPPPFAAVAAGAVDFRP
jgi:hypothetical protein